MTGHDFYVRRRAFLQAVGLLPFGFAQDAIGRDVPKAPPEPLQKMIDDQAARNGGAPIVIPPRDRPLLVRGVINVPDGAILVIQCDLNGSPQAEICIRGRTTLRFENSRVQNVMLRLIHGTIDIIGLNYSGRDHIAAVLIGGPGPFKNLRIDQFQISNANYGVLRQGGHSVLRDAVISNGVFRSLIGDPIEWNVCPHDSGVIVENHDIIDVTAPSGKPNWGLGIGFAGEIYTKDWNPDKSAQNFTIRRITGRSLSQLIHVEAGVNFIIENIRGADISKQYSDQPGHDRGSAIVCYGCRNFVISDVSADGHVLALAGYSRGDFVVPIADCTIENVRLRNGNLGVHIGGKSSYCNLRNIKLDAGSLVIRGEAENLIMSDVDVTSTAPDVDPLTIDPAFLSGALASFRPTGARINRIRVQLRRGVR
ncbi:hypothetical protein [Novosphingobium sp. 11B]